jgi:hypothetical protein
MNTKTKIQQSEPLQLNSETCPYSEKVSYKWVHE